MTEKEIVITQMRGRTVSCLYENGKLTEFWAQPEDGSVRVGDICIGKVKNIARNLRAAFVELRPGVTGYYSLSEHADHHLTSALSREKICAGDEILVQVEGENLKTKDWQLTGDISLQGRYLVCFPFRKDVRISRKIKDPDVCGRLRALAGSEGESDVGWMIRTDAANAGEERIRLEKNRLRKEADQLLHIYRSRTFGSLLREGKSSWQELTDRYLSDPACSICTDLEQVYAELAGRIGITLEKDSCRLKELYTDTSYPLIKLKGLEAGLEKALAKKVWLRSGGSLVIEATEALTSIDVNTGKNQSGRDTGRLFYETNREAVTEALHQIRLRNLSGIILIDLINMKEDEDKNRILRLAREQASHDPVPTSVIDLTKLQLLEITRKKRKQPLLQMLS